MPYQFRKEGCFRWTTAHRYPPLGRVVRWKCPRRTHRSGHPCSGGLSAAWRRRRRRLTTMGNTAVWTLVLTFFGCIMMLWVFHRAPPSEVTANLHAPPTLANSPFVAVSHPSNGSSVGGPRHSCAPCANSSTLRRLLQVDRVRRPSEKRRYNEAEEEVCPPCLSPRKKVRAACQRTVERRCPNPDPNPNPN